MKDFSMHILDILQNSIVAKATKIEFTILKEKQKDLLTFIFKDNGCGMDAETVERVTNPFFTTRTTRKVGLGLPLLKQNAEMTGGTFSISSGPQQGTIVTATFSLSHIDLKPMGDVAGILVLTISSHQDIHFIFTHKTDDNEFVFDSQEVKEALDGVSMQNPEIMSYLKEMIEENIT
ncbi:MAG TPA: ATP-binding protein [Bacteroidales bacterium]|nr:ATP-binding protein [Bacteroidales bacterium]HQA86381.1 ATP-binding protein [Bacteroidales bacterium]